MAAQILVTMDEWMYKKIMAIRPKGQTKAQHCRTLLIEAIDKRTEEKQGEKNE